MKSRFSSLLPLMVLSVGCRDDSSPSSSPVDAGNDRDGAVASSPVAEAGAQPLPSNDAAISNDALTLGLDESADELTIIDQWPTEGRPDASATGSTASGGSSASSPSTSMDAPSWPVETSTAAEITAETTAETAAETQVDTDVWTLVFDTQRDAATGDAATGDGSISNADSGVVVATTGEDANERDAGQAGSNASEPDGDAGARSLRLEGCTLVAGERPATTPTLSAPQVAGLDIEVSVAGQPVAGSVQFQDQEGDAATLIVQVGSTSEHYVCTLSSEDLEAGSVALNVLRLSETFPDGGHTLYVGVSDAAGNVSGYLAGSLTVGAGGAQTVCGQSPRQLIGAVPSQATGFYRDINGSSAVYTAGEPLAIVARTDLFLKIDDCAQLLLAGDATGQAAVGWDNCLLVEYRPTPDAPREAVWSYCPLSIFDAINNAAVPQAQEQPTVPGTQLTPPVPNAAPFGWTAGALDLMRYVPANHPNAFVLNLHLLDFGSVGSTTDIWLTAQPPTVD